MATLHCQGCGKAVVTTNPAHASALYTCAECNRKQTPRSKRQRKSRPITEDKERDEVAYRLLQQVWPTDY